eukprot:COSAG06_NODE_55160_length_291_cov_0.536458_1_plen_93_part_10
MYVEYSKQMMISFAIEPLVDKLKNRPFEFFNIIRLTCAPCDASSFNSGAQPRPRRLAVATSVKEDTLELRAARQCHRQGVRCWASHALLSVRD